MASEHDSGRGQQPLISERGELVGLILVNQRFDNLLKATLDYFIELIKCQVDAVVGNAALWPRFRRPCSGSSATTLFNLMNYTRQPQAASS